MMHFVSKHPSVGPWPPVLTLPEAADVLGFPSVEAARKAFARHGVPLSKIGDRAYVVVDRLLEYLRDHEIDEGKEHLAAAGRRERRGDQLQQAGRRVFRRKDDLVTGAARRLAPQVAEDVEE